ncbi:probable ribonuclease ZC3H12B isoform X2 [Ornithodoros turicata]|uniref:probable ribonuclease ZC3H12B isoform X2 n=1 Tax=Ornithodoros turicata TaxID=34597 RepID=UPI0031393DAE
MSAKTAELLVASTETAHEKRCVYPLDVAQGLLSLRQELERATQALLLPDPATPGTLLVRGGHQQVQTAIQMLDAKAKDLPVREKLSWRRRTLESEDSSYDSDTENQDIAASGSSAAHHEDVCRTVSETLGAEFAEYVSSSGGAGAGNQYATKVEFAVKLGYTEAQVQMALRRLGPQPTQNELLAELIKLGARDPPEDDLAQVVAKSRPARDDELRPIVIDGSNVAMSHGNKEVFSCRGIQLAVEWFQARGHKDISVFVPSWRKEASRIDTPIKGQEILLQLEKERLLFFTPSRNVGGKRMVCYEDRYILKMAAQTDGVVVSNDNYRDLVSENQDFKKVVDERLLMYTFVNDRFMPPDDPLGRHGPSLDAFLRKAQRAPPEGLPPACPYGKKCTYGNKCKYYHPERGNLPQKSVTERLAEQARLQLQEVKARQGVKSRDSSPGELLKTRSLPPSSSSCGAPSEPLPQKKKTPLARTKSAVPSSSLLSKELTEEWHAPLSLHPHTPIGVDHQLGLLEPDGGGHLSVAKRLSDPDSSHYTLDFSPGKDEPSGVTNLHRKLQRQLTLNPAYDPRLFHLHMTAGGHHLTPPVEGGLLHKTTSQENLGHRPLGRSDSSYSPWEASQHHHPEVTRIASAPDSTRQRCQARMQRLSSTSDTKLNVFPQQGVPLSIPSYGYTPQWTPAIPPPQGIPIAPRVVTSPCEVADDPRYKLYYHLSSIFPEEQVRAAMELYPEETNPQKVCAAILSMFPKG